MFKKMDVENTRAHKKIIELKTTVPESQPKKKSKLKMQ
jgi:hypothetical protein